MAPEEIPKLIAAEERKEEDETVARLAKEESDRFFNRPSSAAPYDYYCKLAYWTLDECVALSLGKNPKIVHWKSVGSWVQVSPFAANYANLREMTERAKWAKQLFEPVYPSIFLAWAKEIGFPVCEELLKQSVNAGISLSGWQQLYETQKAITEKTQHDLDQLAGAAQDRISGLEQELSQLRTAAAVQLDKSSATRERESMLKLIIGLACGVYGYDPGAARNTATGEIKRDLERIGLAIDDDTIRKYLREGADLVDPARLAEFKAKPNSPKR
jgi:hypothetical protein